MTPAQMKAIRQALGLSTAQWGRALGYRGANVQVQVRQLENGVKPIPRFVARLALMFERHGVPEGWLEEELERE